MLMESSRNFHSTLVEMQNGTAALETAGCFPTKLNIGSPQDPEIVLLGIYSKELKTGLNQNLHLSVYGRFNPDCPNVEATKTSFSR